MNLLKMLGVIRAYRAGAPLGDVVLLKLDALSLPSTQVSRELEAMRGYAPEHDFARLSALPSGTLGREYARFVEENGIEPLVISAPARARFRERPFAIRYTATHDLHHVLCGFDTGLAGEAGVLAFNVAQGSAPISRSMLWFSCALYALLSPAQARAILHNVRVGLASGARARLVIAQPLESMFEDRLEDVRGKLRLPDPRAAGVLPSGRSILVDLLYPRSARQRRR